jgi:hypothetical protein
MLTGVRVDLHRTARPRFSPLSAGSSVLDALWIVAIILEAAGVRFDHSFQANPLLVAHFVAPGAAQNKNPN